MVKKYTKEMKIKACNDYLSGTKTRKQIARELNMGKKGDERIREWVKMYEINGSLAFNDDNNKNRRYSKELKEMVVNDYYNSYLSELEIVVKYNLSSCSILRSWVSKYNKGEKFKTYINNPEVYNMPNIKTTQEDKIKIVKECIENNDNYGETATKYGMSYHQVYEWCKKYRKYGEDALKDNRGRTFSNIDSTKESNYISQINNLKHRNEQLEREIEVLKKARTLELELIQLQGIKKNNLKN